MDAVHLTRPEGPKVEARRAETGDRDMESGEGAASPLPTT